MTECYCDYDQPEFYAARIQRARVKHRCDECLREISPGERYERVSAKSEGQIWVAKTCLRCLAIRDYVQENVPCFCWEHHNMLDVADETIREYRHELPGMGMAYGRLRVAVRDAPRYA